MRVFIASALLLSCVALTSCGSKELSRSKASDLIKSQLFTSKALESSQQAYPYSSGVPDASTFQSYLKDFHKFQEAGWMTFTEKGCIGACYYESTLTDKGNAESANWTSVGPNQWQIPIARREFIQVTGITKLSPTEAVVEYTYRYVPTEAGRLISTQPSEATTERIQFQLYDDGWRISP